MTDPSDPDPDSERERKRERNRGVAVQLWKREGIILPGHADTVSRWRRDNRKPNRNQEDGK